MDNTLKVVGGVSLGAGLLLLLDPPAGWRRLWRVPEDEGSEPVDSRWSSAARLLAGAAGGGLAVYGAARRDRVGAALGSLGLGLLVRGLSDVPMGRRLAGLMREGVATEVQRAIHVDAPIDTVFGVWADYESYPRFLSRVLEVRDLSDGRSRWVVRGPSGAPVEWDAVLTRFETGRELAWRTVGDEHHARVLLTPDAEGGTRVEVRLSTAPAGPDEVVTLFGSDADRQIDEDLLRMKSHVESGASSDDRAE